MPHDDDAWDDEDAPESSDEENFTLPDMACPECGGRVTEDTQKCPHCGDWITPVELRSGQWKRWWFVVAVLLMLLAMLQYIF